MAQLNFLEVQGTIPLVKDPSKPCAFHLFGLGSVTPGSWYVGLGRLKLKAYQEPKLRVSKSMNFLTFIGRNFLSG